MDKVPLEISHFLILPLTLPTLSSFPSLAKHYAYIQHHKPKIPSADSPRSLFVANVPIDSTELHFRSLFAEQLGGFRVARVDFEEARGKRRKGAPSAGQSAQRNRKRKRAQIDQGREEALDTDLPELWGRDLYRSGSNAVVVFLDRPSAEAAMKAVRRAAKKGEEIVWGKGLDDRLPRLGSERYRTHQDLQFPPHELLQQRVDEYMTQFSMLESSRARAAAQARQVPDEDGFITVTRGGGRIAPAKRDEAQEILQKQKDRQREKAEAMGSFYRFQTREKRKAKQNELMRNFEEDRKKVAQMRHMGKSAFRPR